MFVNAPRGTMGSLDGDSVAGQNVERAKVTTTKTVVR